MINFVAVEQSVKDLKRQLEEGQIDQPVFEARLLEMIDLAEDGYYWMFGHKTERWYRHDGAQWVPDDPGEIMQALNEGNITRGNPAAHASHESGEDDPPDWGWSTAGLVVLAIIGALIYYTTLMP